jgi:hypothetical protein
MMWQAGARSRFARLVESCRALPRSLVLASKLVIVLAGVLLIVLPQFRVSLDASHRYAGLTESEWEGTDNSLSSARCLRQTGIWLLKVCEKDRAVWFSAEDPGQVLLLSLWGQITDRDPIVMDAARLNLWINTICLLILTFVLLGLGAFGTAVVLLLMGPVVYLHWFGTQPHWSFIGIASIQMILPLALVARAKNWLRPSSTAILLAIGLPALALGALMREPVGSMAIIITVFVGAWALVYGPRERRHRVGTVAILLTALVLSQSSRIVVAARDSAYSLDPAQYPATHGISHTLYLGLGIVENKFGIKYLDAMGAEAVAAADPNIDPYSVAGFRKIRELYFQKWKEDPAEMIRIYFEKTKLILSDDILANWPPLGVLLILVIAIQALAWRAGHRGGEVRLAINLIALGFVGFFILQCVLAGPGRLYSMPIGAFILVLTGIAIENVVAWGVQLAAKPATTGNQSRL